MKPKLQTFLEYVAECLMGPAPHHSGRGEPLHVCPFHNDTYPSFLVRRTGSKPRYRCFGCGAWGDELDLVANFYPRDDYARRLDRIAEYRRHYDGSGRALMQKVEEDEVPYPWKTPVPIKWRKVPFLAWPEEVQDEYLYEVCDRADRCMSLVQEEDGVYRAVG